MEIPQALAIILMTGIVFLFGGVEWTNYGTIKTTSYIILLFVVLSLILLWGGFWG